MFNRSRSARNSHKPLDFTLGAAYRSVGPYSSHFCMEFTWNSPHSYDIIFPTTSNWVRSKHRHDRWVYSRREQRARSFLNVECCVIILVRESCIIRRYQLEYLYDKSSMWVTWPSGSEFWALIESGIVSRSRSDERWVTMHVDGHLWSVYTAAHGNARMHDESRFTGHSEAIPG